MKHIVGVVKSVSGHIVNKDFENGIEHEIRAGELIGLNDYVWSRSLDSSAVIVLHNAKVVFKPGMRIKFDEEYLKKVDSYEFLDTDDIDRILQDDLTQKSQSVEQPKQKLEPQPTSNANTTIYNDMSDSIQIEHEVQDFMQSQNSQQTIQTNQSYNQPKDAEDEHYVEPIIIEPSAIEKIIMEAEVVVTSFFDKNPVIPTFKDDYSLYECNFGDIKITINTQNGREVKLFDFNMQKQIAKSIANTDGISVFELKNTKEKARYEFCIAVFDGTIQKFKHKMVVLVDLTKKNAEFSPINVVNFDVIRGYPKTNIEFKDSINIKIDSMKKSDNDFKISKNFYTNEINPVFKFDVQNNIVAKFYLIGFGDYIFDNMIELEGILIENVKHHYFICENNFRIPGKYIFYANFLSNEKGKTPKEFFFGLSIKFRNDDLFTMTKFKDGIVSGTVTSSKSEVVLYSLDSSNVFNKISSTISDDDGNFYINIGNIDYNILNKMVLRSTDVYGNSSAAVGVSLNSK